MGMLLNKPHVKVTFKGALERYWRFLMFFHGYPSKSVMPVGLPCHVEDPTMDISHGDVVHPCVRFIKEGFEGHQWWMVYTPFYARNAKLENPRLCYADAIEGNPPTEWKYYCTIADTPKTGYNSDPSLLFKEGQLYVFWRENESPRIMEKGLARLTVGCMVKDKQITFLSKPLLSEQSEFSDKEVSSTILSNGKGFRAYAIHADFVPRYIFRVSSSVGSRLYRLKIVRLLDALGIANINTCHGVAIWESESLEHSFSYIKTVPFENSSRLYQPWHMEVFEDGTNDDKTLYAVVQSRKKHGRICLAKSVDGETFRFYDKPLMTSKTAGMIGLYKPSVVQAGNQFFLFYTVYDKKNYNLHRLFVSCVDWETLKSII